MEVNLNPFFFSTPLSHQTSCGKRGAEINGRHLPTEWPGSPLWEHNSWGYMFFHKPVFPQKKRSLRVLILISNRDHFLWEHRAAFFQGPFFGGTFKGVWALTRLSALRGPPGCTSCTTTTIPAHTIFGSSHFGSSQFGSSIFGSRIFGSRIRRVFSFIVSAKTINEDLAKHFLVIAVH